jgi:hypothetical protein
MLKARTARERRASQAADCADLLAENPHFVFPDNTRVETLARFAVRAVKPVIDGAYPTPWEACSVNARAKKAPPGRGL